MHRRLFLRTTFHASVLAGLCGVLQSHGAEVPLADVKPFPRAHVAGVYTQAIWSDGRHNGFPGIARVGGFYYVTFRNAESHQDVQAKIFVIRAKADDLQKWEKVAEWTRDHDCRDPLVFDNRGKVQVVFHSKEDFFSQSADGVTWSEPKELVTDFPTPKEGSGLTFKSERRWLFRIRKGPDGAFYSLARSGIKDTGGTFGLILYRSEDGVNFKAMHTWGEGPTSALASAGGSGWGHEADVAWTPDGMLVSAIRNSNAGAVVIGKAPLGPWKGFATDAFNFGGPALHTTKLGGILLAARALPEPKPMGFPAVCKVWTVTEGGVEKPWIVPSGGDCAYQSFADGQGDEVLLCYYSSHEYPQPKGVGHNPTKIYLAHLKVRHTQPSVTPQFYSKSLVEFGPPNDDASERAIGALLPANDSTIILQKFGGTILYEIGVYDPDPNQAAKRANGLAAAIRSKLNDEAGGRKFKIWEQAQPSLYPRR